MEMASLSVMVLSDLKSHPHNVLWAGPFYIGVQKLMLTVRQTLRCRMLL